MKTHHPHNDSPNYVNLIDLSAVRSSSFQPAPTLMRYELFLARRYAFSKRRENFITIISILSIVGLAVGTSALIIVLSVFNGFSSVVTSIYVSFDPHVRI